MRFRNRTLEAMQENYERGSKGGHDFIDFTLTVFSFDERGYRAYQRAGFKEIGRRWEAHRLGGRAYDVI